jgi:2-oxo-4-hydroxy-4-carboxy--5-ureidoimidazoline (OHCU) decarboxylase
MSCEHEALIEQIQGVYEMTAWVIERTTTTVTIQIQIPLSSESMLESEEMIQQVLNEAGTLATGESLKQFDMNVRAIEVAGEK